MLKLVGAVVVIGAAVFFGAKALDRWWNRTEGETVEVLTGQGSRGDQEL